MYGSSYSLFESNWNWNHDLSYLFVMQISPSKILLSYYMLDLHDKEEYRGSWFQYDSNVVCADTHIRKRFFQNWLMSPSRNILCWARALET